MLASAVHPQGQLTDSTELHGPVLVPRRTSKRGLGFRPIPTQTHSPDAVRQPLPLRVLSHSEAFPALASRSSCTSSLRSDRKRTGRALTVCVPSLPWFVLMCALAFPSSYPP